jgi:hypothetical protein
MLMLAFFFFWPAIQMWRTGELVRYLPFIMAHFAMFIFWMSLSFQFYKTFWALWMLMAMAVNPNSVRRVAANKRLRALKGMARMSGLRRMAPGLVGPAHGRITGNVK